MTRVWGTVLVLVAVATGCSNPFGSDPAPADEAADVPADLAAWQDGVEAVCARMTTRLQRLEGQLGTTDSLSDVAAAMDRMVPLFRRYTRAVAAIEVPETQRADVRRVNRINRQSLSDLEVMQAAAHFADPASLAEASRSLLSRGERMQVTLTALGIPECS